MNQNLHITRSVIIAAVLLNILAIMFMIAAYVVTKRQEITSRAESTSVGLYLYPAKVQVKKGKQFVVGPKIVNNTGKSLAAFKLTIHFDQKLVRFVNIRKSNPTDQFTLLKFDSGDISSPSGTLKIFYGLSPQASSSASINLQDITFEIRKEGASFITADTKESQAVFIDRQIAVLLLENSISVNGPSGQEANAGR